MFETIVKYLITPSVIFGILAYFTKSIISHFLSKDIESYKNKIETNAQLKLEEIKNELQIKALEHQIKFNRLHEKRAEIIAEFYQKFEETIFKAGVLVNPLELRGELSKEETLRNAKSEIWELRRFFQKNRIYLSEELCTRIETTINKIYKIIFDFGSKVVSREYDKDIEVWTSSWESITETEVPEARKALEVEFRNILGVE